MYSINRERERDREIHLGINFEGRDDGVQTDLKAKKKNPRLSCGVFFPGLLLGRAVPDLYKLDRISTFRGGGGGEGRPGL